MSPRSGRRAEAPRRPQSGGPPAAIDLHIERIVLDGLPVPWQDRAAVGAAVEAELRHLLTEAAWDGRPDPVAVPSLTAEGIRWAPAEGAGLLGTRIAQAVYGTVAGTIGLGVREP